MKIKRVSDKEFQRLLKRKDIFIMADPMLETFLIMVGIGIVAWGILCGYLFVAPLGLPILAFGIHRYRKFMEWYMPYVRRRLKR